MKNNCVRFCFIIISICLLSNFLSAQNNSATNYIEQGNNAYGRRDYKNAVKFYEKGIESSPVLKAEYYEKLSTAYMYLNDYTNMLRVSREAITLFRLSSTLYFNKGYALYKLGETNKAIAPIEKAIVLNPTSSYMHNYIGLIYLYQSNYLEAQASFLKATVYSPTNVTYLVNLGASYERALNYREALQIYEKAANMEVHYRGLKNSIDRAKFHLYGGTNTYIVSDNDDTSIERNIESDNVVSE